MRYWPGLGLLVCCLILSGLLWGALRAFSAAAGSHSFSGLPDHDYLADIAALRQQGKLTEALALSRFVCDQPTYPQRQQACLLARQLRAQTHSFWYRARSLGHGALTGAADNAWALAGATTADFFVVGDVRDLLIQGWRLSHGQEADELLMALSALGVLTVTVPSFDWLPSFGKIAVRLGALSQRFTDQFLRLSRRAVATGTLAPLHRLVLRLGPAKTLGVLPVVESAEDLATLARVAAKHPRSAYAVLKIGGHEALETLAKADPEATVALLRAARKGAPGLRLWQRCGRRMFTSHLLVGAGKALHRGRLPQAMSLWLAAQSRTVRLLVTALLAGAWVLTLTALWHIWRGSRWQRSAHGR
jgi:hypothetical protein